jgi:DNA-binding MarR family transcriptional regulator
MDDGAEGGGARTGSRDGPRPVGTLAGGDVAELASRLRVACLRLARRLRGQGDEGLTASQASALASLRRLGSPTLGELAAAEQVQPPSITRLVEHLERLGLVERLRDRQDRRVHRVTLTKAGTETLERSRSRKTAYLAQKVAALDERDRADLARFLDLLERLAGER